jgi:hypothetical protein
VIIIKGKVINSEREDIESELKENQIKLIKKKLEIREN